MSKNQKNKSTQSKYYLNMMQFINTVNLHENYNVGTKIMFLQTVYQSAKRRLKIQHKILTVLSIAFDNKYLQKQYEKLFNHISQTNDLINQTSYLIGKYEYLLETSEGIQN